MNAYKKKTRARLLFICLWHCAKECGDKAIVENTYYHYGKAEQVTAPGMSMSVGVGRHYFNEQEASP
jgi:hypothetical protein